MKKVMIEVPAAALELLEEKVGPRGNRGTKWGALLAAAAGGWHELAERGMAPWAADMMDQALAMPDAPGLQRERLGDAGCIFVTAEAAKVLAEHEGVDEESARLRLTELLLAAKRTEKERYDGCEEWRLRDHGRQLDIFAVVRVEGAQMVIVERIHLGRGHGRKKEAARQGPGGAWWDSLPR